MSPLRRTLLPLLLLFGGTAPALAQVPGTPARPATAEARQAAVATGLERAIQVAGREPERWTIQQRMEVYGVPAVSVAVVHDGRLDWARAWGWADVASKREATPSTLFQAASMSKSVAALGALTMVEDGLLSLDGDVNDALVAWKVPENAFTAARPVTLRALLSHTAGTTVHGFPGYAAGEPVPTTVQVLEGAGNTAAIVVDTVPGAVYRYSGGGYTIAQLLMAERAGRPFAELMRERVLDPLGMEESTYRQPLPAAMREQAATGYRQVGQPVKGLYHTYPEMAAAGLWTTPSDYARYVMGVQAAYAERPGSLVSRDVAVTMLTPVLGDYGLGLGIAGAADSLRFAHGGANEGFRSQFVGYAGSGEGVVVMTNSDTGSPLAQEVILAVARVYGWPGLAPRVVTAVPVDPATLAHYAGTYTVGGTRLDVTVEGDRLMLAEDGGTPLELVPTGEDAFVYVGGGIALTFERDAAGAVTAIRAGNARAERSP